MLIHRIFLIFNMMIKTVQTAVPVFSNITVPIQVREDATLETLLDSFNVIDPDGSDVSSCSHTGDSGEFDIRQNTADNTLFELYVLAGSGIEYDTTSSYILSVSCIDAQSESGTRNIQIDVIPNQPPAITTAASPISVNENVDVQTQLYTLNVSDVENDPFICDVKYTNPTSSIFDVWWNSTNSEYQLFLLSNPGLSFSVTSTYTVTVECWDDFGSSTSNVVVFVTPNSAPIFNNLPDNLYLDASTTSMGTTVFIVTATDVDSTSLTFSMTSYPVTQDLFSIDAVSGEITVEKDLIYAVDNAYQLTVTASDSKTTTGAELKILLSNTNTVPIIENLPYTVYKDEDIASNSVIFSVDSNDPDPGDSVTLTFTVWPTAYTSKFYMSHGKSLRLQPSENFDYEDQNYFRIEFTASDGKASNGPYTLNLYISDVHEKCSFDLPTYYVSMFEGNAGTDTADPGFIITDEDLGDTYSLSIDYSASSDSTYFSIDSTSGIITFATAYDVDTTHSSNVTLIAVCTDSTGKTGTATVSVTIEDVNDNAPQFSNTGYISYIDQYDTPTTTVKLMNMVCKDKDSGLNGVVSFSWTQITAGSGSFFHMNSKGIILLMTYPALSMTYGDIFTFTITGTDHGTPPLSTTTTLDIIYKETNNSAGIVIPTTTTTTASNATTTTTAETTTKTTSFWDESVNIMVVVLAAIIGALLSGLAIYLCLKKFKTFKRWKNGRVKVIQRKVEPKPSQDKKTFDFWNQNDP